MKDIHDQCQTIANRLAAGAATADIARKQLQEAIRAANADPFDVCLKFTAMYLEMARKAEVAEQSLTALSESNQGSVAATRSMDEMLKIANRKLAAIATIVRSSE